MLPANELLTFFAAAALLAIAPGPDNIFVMTQSALHGRLAGIAVTFGLCTGLIVHTFLVAIGVAALIKASATAFMVLKIMGALYLLYLAYGAFRASASNITMEERQKMRTAVLYRRGIFMNVTNPKVTIFFLAFLPQFVNPEYGSVTLQFAELGVVFIVATLLIFGSVAIIGGTVGTWLNANPKAQKIMNWTAGTIFCAMALKLLVSER